MAAKNPDRERLLTTLTAIDFADRYYALCARFTTGGPDLSVSEQAALMDELGRGFTYDKPEKFFGYRDLAAPTAHQLGLNVSLRDALVELIFVYATPAGHVGEPFSAMALAVRRRSAPTYRHFPPHPAPVFASKAQAREALADSLALYDAIKQALLNKRAP